MSDLREKVRLDHKLILEMVKPNTKVLDLGCGDGELVSLLIKHNGCKGAGLEIDENAVYKCVEKGVTISQGDLDSGLTDYADKAFDYVILNESVQEVLNPEKIIQEALRVGKYVIVGVPNFGHYLGRLQIFFLGRVPVTKWLPYKWYNTPNLRFLTIKDFRQFCREKGIKVIQERGITLTSEVSFLRNLFAYVGIFLIRKD